MALSPEGKKIVETALFERACEIEGLLSEDNFFLAKMAGVKPEQVSDVALKTAIKEFKKALSTND